MNKKYLLICIILYTAALSLIPLNLFLFNYNMPESICVAASLLIIICTVLFFIKSGNQRDSQPPLPPNECNNDNKRKATKRKTTGQKADERKTAKQITFNHIAANQKPVKRITGIFTGVLAVLSIAILIPGSYCNPYWNGTLFRINANTYSQSYNVPLSSKEAIEDLEYAMKYLKKLHPAFYKGVPENISRQYETVKARLAQCGSISVGELAGEIESVFSLLRDGHTFVRGNYDDRKIMKYYRQWANAGFEITAVNGISIEELLEQKSNCYSFEVPSWEYEWLSDDIVTVAGIDYLGFDIENGVEYALTAADGQTRMEECYSDDFLSWDEYAEFNGIDESRTTEESFVSYEIDMEKNIAILHLNECIYNSEYIGCVREMFAEVKEKKIENVAVDLRDNGGGSSQVVSEFFRYLNRDSYKVATIGWRLGFFYLHLGSGISENKKYEELLFDGDLYLFTSAGTFSSAMMFAEYVKDNELGTIIGEAAGNNPNGYGEIVGFNLPCSKLFMQISTKRFYRADKECSDELVYPDIACDSESAMEVLYEQLTEN